MIQDVLRRHNLQPDRERGQHFLDDPGVVETMVEAADLSGEETVLEIGAGLGTITRALAGEAGEVLAYENDPPLARALEQEVADRDNVTVHEEDVLKADVPAFDVCISNIPFHLSSDILDVLVDRGRQSVLLVQQEFAERLTAEPGEDAYGLTTVMANLVFLPVYLEQVPQRSFYPEMEVDAAVVRLVPRNEDFGIERQRFREIMNAMFVHSTKKLRNAFYDSRHMFEIERGEAKRLRDELPHAETRVRELDVRACVEVARAVEQALD